MSNGPIPVKLQSSEAEILAAASRLLAAHVAVGGVTDDNVEAVAERCARHALHLALHVDRLVQSDGESTGLRGPREVVF